jgi:hypothetical protein
MKEEITDADDYADWIQWAADGERHKQNLSKVVSATGESVLLQVQRMEITTSGGNVGEQIIDDVKGDTRWKDICQKLRSGPRRTEEAIALEASGEVPGCVCLEQRRIGVLYSRGALDRHARISTLSGSSWTTVILGGGGSETPDRCVGGPRQDETK